MKRPLPSSLMRAHEVAEHFGVNTSTVWRWIKAGVLPQPVRIAGATRWRKHEIEAVTADETAA